MAEIFNSGAPMGIFIYMCMFSTKKKKNLKMYVKFIDLDHK